MLQSLPCEAVQPLCVLDHLSFVSLASPPSLSWLAQLPDAFSSAKDGKGLKLLTPGLIYNDSDKFWLASNIITSIFILLTFFVAIILRTQLWIRVICRSLREHLFLTIQPLQ